MFLDKDNFLLNDISIGNYISEIEYGYNKVWGSDTGRNLKAVMSGTFLGVVVKFKLKTIKLTQEELEFLAPIFNSPYLKATYYDPEEKKKITVDVYTGDWATLNINSFSNVARANEPFSISIIATKPR